MNIEEKICTMCKKTKKVNGFSKLKSSKDGFKRQCKSCLKKIDTKYIESNRDKVNERGRAQFWKHREKRREESKKYYQKNKKSILEKVKNYAHENKNIIKERYKIWYLNADKAKLNEKTRVRNNKKRRICIQYKLTINLRRRLLHALKNNYKTGSAIADLGCSILELKLYLESLFTNGMSWDNYGTHGWHIDHIEPLCSFDLTNPEEVKIACNYKNLRPLWAKHNCSKAANDKKKKKHGT